ncbi:hypothetical protein NMK54_21310 [Nocardia otitidiscaviarum]|nr:hypothetical protein [Nocardia otitidiscaviarum]
MEKLKEASGHWYSANFHLQMAKKMMSDVMISEAEVGLWTNVYDGYKSIPQFINDRLFEGISASSSISMTLNWAHSVYKKEEDENVHGFTGLY